MKSIESIEKFAQENYVPIARKDFVDYLKNLVIKRNYHEVLEIGSAIAYTSINLALLKDVYVTTIEHNQKRYNKSIENITDFNLNDKIRIIFDDAENVFLSLKYDVIFIDAAKRKNQLFFDKFKSNLNDNGVIIIDNMRLDDFKKYVSPKKAKFYDNVNEELRKYLESQDDFKITYLDLGDGIVLIEKKNSLFAK